MYIPFSGKIYFPERFSGSLGTIHSALLNAAGEDVNYFDFEESQ